jgi:hypothetical protein
MLQGRRFGGIVESDSNINRLTKKRLFRVIAILFLVYTGLDLTVPGVCSEEFSEPGIVAVSGVANSCASLYSLSSADSQRDFPQDQSPSRSSQDDDCFCCCSHVLRGHAPAVIASEKAEHFVTLPIGTPLLSPPLASLFHPPRNA